MPYFLGETFQGDTGVHNPAYLMKSRCGVFFFRWPIPKQLHPLKAYSHIKLSLGTREPQKALRLARYLSQIGETLSDHGLSVSMNYAEIRTILKTHFTDLLDARKKELDATGPMDAAKLLRVRDQLASVDLAIANDEPLAAWYGQDDTEALDAIKRTHGIALDVSAHFAAR